MSSVTKIFPIATVLIVLLGFVMNGCSGFKEGLSYTYNYKGVGCQTGRQIFNSKTDYCKGLMNESLNKSCAQEKRSQSYSQVCKPKTTSEKKGIIDSNQTGKKNTINSDQAKENKDTINSNQSEENTEAINANQNQENKDIIIVDQTEENKETSTSSQDTKESTTADANLNHNEQAEKLVSDNADTQIAQKNSEAQQAEQKEQPEAFTEGTFAPTSVEMKDEGELINLFLTLKINMLPHGGLQNQFYNHQNETMSGIIEIEEPSRDQCRVDYKEVLISWSQYLESQITLMAKDPDCIYFLETLGSKGGKIILNQVHTGDLKESTQLKTWKSIVIDLRPAMVLK